jgi:hypothetical protein
MPVATILAGRARPEKPQSVYELDAYARCAYAV